MPRLRPQTIFAEINITPLTDVFLVLLVIVIIVAPFFSNMRRDVRTPRLAATSQLEEGLLTVEITADGRLFSAGMQLRESELESFFRANAATAVSRKFVIRGDRQVQSRSAFAVLEAAEAAGFTEAIVAGEIARPAAAAKDVAK